MVESSKVLSQNLFLLNDTFQPSLLRVRELCVDASLLKLHQIKQGECHTLEPYPYPYPYPSPQIPPRLSSPQGLVPSAPPTLTAPAPAPLQPPSIPP